MPATSPSSSSATHTPGPWKVARDAEGSSPYHQTRYVTTSDWDEEEGERGDIIARVTDHPDHTSNARLIAAAPDLLKECQEVLPRYIEMFEALALGNAEESVCVIGLRRAIAAATGKQVQG